MAEANEASKASYTTHLWQTKKTGNESVIQGWIKKGGAAVEELMQNTDLIDARYLIDLSEKGLPVPCCQEVPVEAKISLLDVWRLRLWFWGGGDLDTIAVLVLS